MAFMNYTAKPSLRDLYVAYPTQYAGLYSKVDGESLYRLEGGDYAFKQLNAQSYWVFGSYTGSTFTAIETASTVSNNPWDASWLSFTLYQISRDKLCQAGEGRLIAILSTVVFNDGTQQAPYNMLSLVNQQSLLVFRYGVRVAPGASAVIDNKFFIPSNYSLYFITSNPDVRISVSASLDKVR